MKRLVFAALAAAFVLLATPVAAQEAPTPLPHPPGDGFYCTTWDATWEAHRAFSQSRREGERARNQLVERGLCARLREGDILTKVEWVVTAQPAGTRGSVPLVFRFTLDQERIVFYLLLPEGR